MGKDVAPGAGTGPGTTTGPVSPRPPSSLGPGSTSASRWAGGAWRSILFAPIGDGQTRRRGSDAVRVVAALLVIVVCWLATRVNSSSERTVIHALTPPPDGIRWLVTSVWWLGSLGLTVAVVVLALISRRWSVVRDCLLSGVGAFLVCIVLGHVLGADGGRPPSGATAGFNVSFPVARVAATVGAPPPRSRSSVGGCSGPSGSRSCSWRWPPSPPGSGLPVAVLASLAVGVPGHGRGPPDLRLASRPGVRRRGDRAARRPRHPRDRRGPRTGARSGGSGGSPATGGAPLDVAVYGRDASDAQLLAKTARFLLYRDSGPTLTLTRRQQVEHEAYVTLFADRAGARVARVVAAGPAGPARDALLVTVPPAGRPLSDLPAYAPPEVARPDGRRGMPARRRRRGRVRRRAVRRREAAHPRTPGRDALRRRPDAVDDGAPRRPSVGRRGRRDGRRVDDAALDEPLPSGGGPPGGRDRPRGHLDRDGLVDETGPVRPGRHAGWPPPGRPGAARRDVAAAMSAAALVAGSERAVASAAGSLQRHRWWPPLPFLQRAALDRWPPGRYAARRPCWATPGRRGPGGRGRDPQAVWSCAGSSWINIALVAGTLIGGWALIAVLVNVSKSWSTITGADWAWVAVTFVLAQAVYPAIAITTVGSVTSPCRTGAPGPRVRRHLRVPGRGLDGRLATRIRFFQKQGQQRHAGRQSGCPGLHRQLDRQGRPLPDRPAHRHRAVPPRHAPRPGDGSGSSTQSGVDPGDRRGGGRGGRRPPPRRAPVAPGPPPEGAAQGHRGVGPPEGPGHPPPQPGGDLRGQRGPSWSSPWPSATALHAFGEHLGLAALLVVLTLASMLGGVSPVPGGMGVVEAGMILGLTAFGISETERWPPPSSSGSSPPTFPPSGGGSPGVDAPEGLPVAAERLTADGRRPTAVSRPGEAARSGRGPGSRGDGPAGPGARR